MNKIVADANRYRWLRDRSENAIIDIVSARKWVTVKGYKKQLDDLIDRELSKATPECLEMAEVITEPLKKEWVGLTDEEIKNTKHHMVDGAYDYSFKQGAGFASEVRVTKL